MPSDAHKIYYYITEANIKNFVLFARKPKDNQLWMLMVMQNENWDEQERKKQRGGQREKREGESKADQEVVVVEVKALTEKRTLYSSSSSC